MAVCLRALLRSGRQAKGTYTRTQIFGSCSISHSHLESSMDFLVQYRGLGLGDDGCQSVYSWKSVLVPHLCCALFLGLSHNHWCQCLMSLCEAHGRPVLSEGVL